MYSKRICAGLLMLLGLISGVTACGGVDGERFPEQAGDGDDMSAQSALDGVDSSEGAKQLPQFPNCGIIACPEGTACAFDAEGFARCTAPPGVTCSTLNCGAYHYCQMTASGAICVAGSSDI